MAARQPKAGKDFQEAIERAADAYSDCPANGRHAWHIHTARCVHCGKQLRGFCLPTDDDD